MYVRPLPSSARLCVGLMALGLLLGTACSASQEQVLDPQPPAVTPEPAAQHAAMPASLRAAYLQARQQEAGPEYLVQERGAQMVAENAAHHLALQMDSQGVYLRHTEAAGHASLRLARAGCSAEPAAVSQVSPRAQGTRVEYVHAGLLEWYQNGPMGLEQGFTIPEPGPGGKDCQTLALELQLDGELWAQLGGSADLTRIELQDPKTGRRIYYSDLFAKDAAGRELSSRMELAEHTIRLEVDAAGAQYPIEVDPMLWAEQQKLDPSDGASFDSFGYSVAVSGDTAVVGSFEKAVSGKAQQGEAYVYFRTGTTWTEQQKLTASDGAAGDQFGTSVAISADTIVVGAYQKTVAGKLQQGEAYVYFRTGTTWTEQQKLIASDGLAGDEYGVSVGISADTAVVGAYKKKVGANTMAGQAYVYLRTGTTWTEQQKLTASDGAAMDEYGQVVAISADTVVIGTPSKKVGNNTNQGQVYVYLRTGTTWNEQQKLVASDGASPDRYGNSVAISVDTIVVGAMDKQINGNGNQGEIYVYLRSGTIWNEQQKLFASDGMASDNFGSAVAVSGDTAVVGALGKTVAGQPLQGQAYAYIRSGTTWREQQKLTASDGTVSDEFGISVSVSGDTAVVGAFQHSVAANAHQGQAYVFLRTLYPNGAACTYPTDCASGFCVVSICCDAACGSGICDTGHCRLYADLSISVTGMPTSGIDPTPFVIQVQDLGPNAAENATVVINVPADAPLISAGGQGWTCTTVDSQVTCTTAAVALGPQPPITVTVRAPYNDSSITVAAQVSSTNPDPVPTNNSASATVVNDNPLSSRYIGGGLGGCALDGGPRTQAPWAGGLLVALCLAVAQRRRRTRLAS